MYLVGSTGVNGKLALIDIKTTLVSKLVSKAQLDTSGIYNWPSVASQGLYEYPKLDTRISVLRLFVRP